jgi:hypothetical protein
MDHIMSESNEVGIVRQVGSFMNSLCFACYINVILISLTRRQAAVAGKEAGKIASLHGRRSGSNLRTVTLCSDKGQRRDMRTLAWLQKVLGT